MAIRKGITLSIAAFGLLVVIDSADACRGPQFELGLFYEPPPTGIKVDLIADVTITALVLPDGLGPFEQMALARVHKVLKGHVEDDVIRLAFAASSCGPYLGEADIGRSGIIAGKIGEDRNGMVVVFARGESQYERDHRLGKR